MVNALINRSKDLLKNEHKSILSAAAIIAASYLASALLGLIRNHLLAARFFGGLEADLDVYFAAFVIPDTIFQLLVIGAVSASFIPVFQDEFKKSESDGYHLANSALTIISLIFIALSLLLAIFARPLSGILTHYPAEKLELMSNLIRLMCLAQVFFTFSAFVTGILQARRRFLIPAIAPLLYNLGTILGIVFLSARFGIYSAAIGVVIGSLLHLLIQIPLVFHLGFRPKIIFDPKHPGVITMLKLMPARTLALGVDQVERWVAVNLTSLLVAGSLSIFNFARQLYVLPISLFGVSLSQASFPTLSEEATQKDTSDFKQTLNKSILQIFFFALPAGIIFLILRIPLVRLAFGARNFPWDATLLTGRALALLSLSIAPQAVTHIFTRAFHALKDTKTPLYIGTTTTILFVVFSYLFSRVMNYGILGITLAMSLTSFLDFGLLYYFLRRQVGPLGISGRIIKMIIVSFFTAVSLWAPMRLLDQFVFDTTRTLPLIFLTLTVGLVGFSVYLLFCKIMGLEELVEVTSLLKKLGNWRRVLGKTDEVIESNVSEQ